MFDKILQFIVDFWESLLPYIFIREYEQGVVLRFGKFNRTLEKGAHLKIPFFEEVIAQHVVITTLSLPAQSLYTKDAKNIVVKGVIKYRISDIKTFLLEVFDANDAISDMTQSIIKNVIMTKTFEECTNEEIDNTLTKKTRVEAKKWGVEIFQVTLTDLAPIPTIRLMNDSSLMKFD
jgi:regulator of protease activity HflC (stomatin/prohibitin superfamily)